MLRMSEAVGVIATGVFGIAGTLAGMYVGRRQMTDQAQVEHGQWLRGQRQEAYVQFLNAWEEALTQYRGDAEDWYSQTAEIPFYEGDGEDAMLESVANDTQQALARVQPFLERVQILGPNRVEQAAAVLNTTLVDIRASSSSSGAGVVGDAQDRECVFGFVVDGAGGLGYVVGSEELQGADGEVAEAGHGSGRVPCVNG